MTGTFVARLLPRLPVPALVAAGIAVPYVLRSYAVSLISLAFIAALLAASVNFLAGQMHLVSVGHAGIAASASYAVAWAHNHGHGYGTQLALAALLTVAVSVVYALTSMRTGGIFFLMVTLALGMVVFGLAYRMSQVTGGENGLSGMRRPPMFAETWKFYYLTLAALVLAVAALWVVTRSPFGLVLRGIRDSETRMTSLGYSVAAYKFGAILMSGAVAGLAGVMAVWHAEFVSPSAAGFLRSALTVIMVILGGVGTILGPILGAGIVIWTENVLSTYVERWPTVLGLIFIVVVLFAPKGIVGALKDLVGRRRAARRRTAEPESDDVTGTTAASVPSSTPSGSLKGPS